MWNLLRRKSKTAASEPPSALKGAPPRLRLKTYSAETGFVYQYIYRGYRESEDPAGTRFVFDISRASGLSSTLSICLSERAVTECERNIGRQLLAAERYAAAKLTLFDVFDREPTLPEVVAPSASALVQHLQKLGRV